MIKIVKDKKGKYTTVFNTNTGEYLRGFDTVDEPFMSEFPHLIDIGTQGHCLHGRSGLCMKAGIKCYQDGLHSDRPNMSLENYKKIIDECKDKLFETALGGAGDVDQHENFEEILRYTRENNIVPNFTTSGLGMTPEKAVICKKYCGAVAVSMYSRLKDTVPELALRIVHSENNRKVYRTQEDVPVKFTLGNIDSNCIWDAPEYKINGLSYSWDELHHMYYSDEPQEYEFFRVFNEAQEPNYTMQAIQMLLDAGVKTNIHYVLSNSTIKEALIRLKYKGFPQGINAIVFLLHKPVGLGTAEDVLDVNDPNVKEFFEFIDNNQLEFKVGFDSCSIPGILNFCKNIDIDSIDTCEGSRFSMYIDADMIALPCSFDNQDKKYGVQLSESVSIQDAWNSPEFERFRNSLRTRCKGCNKKEVCMGGCPLQSSIVLCDSKERGYSDVED